MSTSHAAFPVRKTVLVLSTLLAVCVLIFFGDFAGVPPLTLLLLVASASFLIVRSDGAPDLLHPVRVFGALWCFCLAIASMHLLPLISEWSWLAWNCFLTALCSFVGGFWIAKRFTANRRTPAAISTNLLLDTSVLPIRRTLVAAAICIATGTLVLAFEYSLIGEIPVLSQNIDAARMELFGAAGQGDPKFDTLFIKLIHPFVEFIKYGLVLAMVVLFQKNPKSRRVVFFSLSLIAWGTLTYASQGGRLLFVEIAVTCAVLMQYLRQRIRVMQFCAAILTMFLFLGFMGSLRVKSSESAPLFERALRTSDFPEGEFWDGIAFGYTTLTSSFEVFYRLTEDLRSLRRPEDGSMFYALHRFFPRTNLQEVDFDLYGSELITPTFLGEFYTDYGYSGVLFGSLILGLAYGWAYSQDHSKYPIYWLYVRAVLLKNLILFPYVNLFSQYVTWVLDLTIMYFIIRRLSPQHGHPLKEFVSTNDVHISSSTTFA